MSTLRGDPLIRVSLHVPQSGAWYATVTPASGKAPALGPATLVVGDLTLVGSVIRSGEDQPDQPTAVVVGGAGWRTLLAREGRYAAPAGVRLATVLADLCGLVGEAYDAPTDVSMGPAYEWPAAAPPSAYVRADAVLADLVVRGAVPTWRVDPATGRTTFTPWPSIGAADDLVRVLDRDLDQGIRTLGCDGRVAALLPGATIEGEEIRSLDVLDTAGALTATTWSVKALGLGAHVRRIILRLFPWLARIRIEGGDLVIKSASTRIHLAGGASDPGVALVGTNGGRLYLDTLSGVLYYSPSATAAYVPIANGIVPPLPTTPGTSITLSGSTKVTAAP